MPMPIETSPESLQMTVWAFGRAHFSREHFLLPGKLFAADNQVTTFGRAWKGRQERLVGGGTPVALSMCAADLEVANEYPPINLVSDRLLGGVGGRAAICGRDRRTLCHEAHRPLRRGPAADRGAGSRYRHRVEPGGLPARNGAVCGQDIRGDSATLPAFEYEVAVGKPAAEILRVARERSCELIVISTHGLTGIRKLFFGSTTERVLRETTVPVLVTPPLDPGPVRLEDATRLIGRIVVPVDLSPASLYQTQVAYALAEALGAAMILVHVIEPLKTWLAARLPLARIEADRRAIAEDGLGELMAIIPPRLHREALVANGDPAEELAKVVHDRHAGLVVMGLHGSPLLGPRMGSVTYRLLCSIPRWFSPSLQSVSRQRVRRS